MTLIPGLSNTLWYFIAYGAVTALAMRFMPKNKRKKILTYTPQGSHLEKGATIISMISKYAAMLVSLFVPIAMNPLTLWAGNALYAVGLTLATLAMWQFSKAELDLPITSGIYRISRNPMQVMGFVLCIGIAVIGNNVFLWILMSST
ncbi:MAG: phosphatidylethanolamine N-methyltransferase family protein [Gracilibacteraceae bacterium]|jgi:protein-S-isoprenylcysteine O-methyltransferase Ste14|nr:phosphatidylethanolamine N-methyltransferase family protein [Gracilibacteraceae bacterium]